VVTSLRVSDLGDPLVDDADVGTPLLPSWPLQKQREIRNIQSYLNYILSGHMGLYVLQHGILAQLLTEILQGRTEVKQLMQI
jgi:hypothetical protein